MAVNPDIQNYEDMDIPYVPMQGQLQFVERAVTIEDTEVPEKRRILQQYQWSATDGKWDWYDVPMVKDDG